MQGFINYIKARLHREPPADERRAAPRFATHLEDRLVVNVSLLEAKAKPDNARLKSVLAGYTRDVSEVGLGIVVPDIRIGGLNITRPDRRLRIMLGLPGQPVEIHAVPIRYVELEEEENGEQARYLIGMLIKEMSPSHRSQYDAFLKSLQ
ncbi:MAG TPA: hypothetical protein VIW80_17480 [Pyrinomonadaceae bacterium]|jgi:hypothetical protein